MSIKLIRAGVIGFKSIVLVAALLSVAACATKRHRAGGANGEDVIGVSDTMRFYGTNISPAEERELLAQKTYFFGYDKFNVGDNDLLSIYAHAKRLVNNPQAQVRVEGHTDSRGSREYNVALGERRANAVANILMLKGVGQNQISVVSYGKEKPAVSGDDESAFSQNRRAVVVYEVE